MGLEVRFPSDLENAIVSTTVSTLASACAHGFGNVEYLRGVWDTARAQSLAFGLDWASIRERIRVASESTIEEGE